MSDHAATFPVNFAGANEEMDHVSGLEFIRQSSDTGPGAPAALRQAHALEGW